MRESGGSADNQKKHEAMNHKRHKTPGVEDLADTTAEQWKRLEFKRI